MAGISPADLVRLRKGRLPKGDSRERLQKVLFLFRAMDEHVTSGLGLWLRAPNTGFDGATPLEAIEHGKILWLWQTLVLFGLGEPSDAALRLFTPAGRRAPLDRFHFQPRD